MNVDTTGFTPKGVTKFVFCWNKFRYYLNSDDTQTYIDNLTTKSIVGAMGALGFKWPFGIPFGALAGYDRLIAYRLSIVARKGTGTILDVYYILGLICTPLAACPIFRCYAQ
jgi:hypothetical protein